MVDRRDVVRQSNYASRAAAMTDFVLLLNDDTQSLADMVDVLVSESAGSTRSSLPSCATREGRVVNSGVWVDWRDYAITQRTEIRNPLRPRGRSTPRRARRTLVPIPTMAGRRQRRATGLPHYGGDCEFSMRLDTTAAPADDDQPHISHHRLGPRAIPGYWTRASWRGCGGRPPTSGRS